MTIPPLEYNKFTILQGAEWTVKVAFRKGTDRIVLAGGNVRLTIKKKYEDTVYILQADVPSNNVVINGDNTATITLPHSLTSTLPAGRFPFNITYITADSKVGRGIEGTILISPKV